MLLEGQLALKEVEELCDTLHLWLSEDKKQEAAQRVKYTGIIVDTIRGRFFCPEGKRAKLVAALKEMGVASAMSARGVAGVRGKVLPALLDLHTLHQGVRCVVPTRDRLGGGAGMGPEGAAALPAYRFLRPDDSSFSIFKIKTN